MAGLVDGMVEEFWRLTGNITNWHGLCTAQGRTDFTAALTRTLIYVVIYIENVFWFSLSCPPAVLLFTEFLNGQIYLL